MKHDLTTGTWQDDTGCPISIILVSTSDVGITLRMPDTAGGGGYMGFKKRPQTQRPWWKYADCWKTKQSFLLAHSFYLKTASGLLQELRGWLVCLPY